MTRSITWNGVTRYRPGGITKISVSPLDQVGISARGIIGLVGEADGGEPGSSAGLVVFNDPSKALETYKSGPLVDAIRLAFQSSGDPLVPGGASEVVVYKTNSSAASSINLPRNTVSVVSDTAAAGSTTTTVNLTTGGLTVNAMVGRWVDVTLAALPGSPVYRRRITANAASALTVTPALPAAPSATNPVAIRANWLTVTSRDYGAHTNGISVDVAYDTTNGKYQVTVSDNGVDQISEQLGGRNYMQVLYRGGANAVASDTVNTATTTVSSIALTSGGLTPSAHAGASLVITPDPTAPDPIYLKITTNSASALTLDKPLTADQLAALQNGVSTVEIKNVTNAVGLFTGASGVATVFTTTVTGVTGDNLSISLAANMTLRDLVKEINKNVNYLATIPGGVNADTTLAANFDFATSNVNIQTMADNTSAGFRQDINDIVVWFNNNCQYATAVRPTTATLDGQTPPVTDPVYSLAPTSFELVGGSRGTSTNSSFQAGLDALLTRKVDYVVPLVDQNLTNEGYGSTATWASVSQQLRAHVILGRGTAGLERGGFIGFIGTKTALVAASNSLNDPDVQIVGQNPMYLDSTSSLVTGTPRLFAVMAASMRAGVPEIGEPLTHKLIRTAGLTQDASWDPTDLTDSADLIKAGCLFAEYVPGTGYRWVRDLTTYTASDNICLAEGSVRDAVRAVAYTLRTEIDNRFTGRKATPTTIASIRDLAVKVLEKFRGENVIVDSTDPVTGQTVKAYHNLKVYSEGDVARLVVSIFPVPGINFEISEIYLQTPSQAA